MPWLQEPNTRPKSLWKAVIGLEACQHAWSSTFARAVLTWLRTVSATLDPFMAFSADLRNTWLPRAGRFLPLDCHDEARTGWPTATPHWDWWAPALATCLRLLQFRRAMYEELAR